MTYGIPTRWDIPDKGLAVHSNVKGWYVFRGGKPLETRDGKRWRVFKSAIAAAKVMERLALEVR